jgi:glycosyltransferase involved in cell wall biosynthesis
VAVADAIVTDSENSRRDIERFFPRARGRVTVAPLAAHPRFRRLEGAEAASAVAGHGVARPFVLYVGTLEPGKNVARVIRAFDAVAADRPGLELVVIGDRGWLYEPILAEARAARHADRIRLLGHLPDDEVVAFLNQCEAFVFPSLYEGFGLPPLEAMACGAPVITSGLSSLPEVVGDAALVVDPLSESGIAAAMARVLSDPGLARGLREAGLAQAAKFSWRRTAELTLAVYRAVARGR